MTTTPVVSITDELLAEIERLAGSAGSLALDTAETIEDQNGAMIECPVCCGEGYASAENDYCNFDNHAIGVQFYGIGPEFGLAEAYFRAANPTAVLTLTTELRRLRAEVQALTLKAEYANNNHMASLMLVADIRAAAGDPEGRLMQPELVAHIEALRVDAGRYRWLRGRLPGSAYRIAGVIYSEGGAGVDAAIDTAMQSSTGTTP